MIPILLILGTLSFMHYWRERTLLQDQVRLSARQLGEVLLGSLHHALLMNDEHMLADILADVGGMGEIRQVQLVNLEGQVKVHSHSEFVGQVHHLEDAGCQECHQFPVGSRPHTARLILSEDTLRIATPIDNEPDCSGCHAEEGSHLGVLLADVSFIDIQDRLMGELRTELLLSAIVTLGLIVAIELVHLFVVRRKMAMREPLARLAAGDFSVRMDPRSGPLDELARVAEVFNRMAAELERRERAQQERHAVREQAIAEERMRIARDLHDGLGQLLGFVNTKAMAARLMLKKQEIEGADRYLYQLEEAARELFTDVREAVLNLRVASPQGDDLVADLQAFIARFNQLSGLPVEFSADPSLASLGLDTQVRHHLFRTVQEALNNVRKHASATRAWVDITVTDGVLELVVGDDGLGFDPAHISPDPDSHFGLSTMRERAAEVGADLVLESDPGSGTRIVVRMPLDCVPRGVEKESE